MDKYDKHICKSQPNGVSIEYCGDYFQDDFSWHLVIAREADETDLVNNHYLENIGDELWSVMLEINCCPYCGKSLESTKGNGGRFALFNSIGGSVDVI